MAPHAKRRKLDVVQSATNKQRSAVRQSANIDASARNLAEDNDSSEEDSDGPSRVAVPYSGLLGALNIKIQGEERNVQSRPAKSTNKPHVKPTKHSVKEERAAAEGQDSDEETADDPFDSHFANPDEALLSQRLDRLSKDEWTVTNSLSELGKHALKQLSQESGNSESAAPAYKLKKRLQEPRVEVRASFATLDSHLTPLLTAYRDVLYCGRTVENAEGLRKLTCLHALNHILKTRDRILKNTARLARDQSSTGLECRDQGFTRPKVLILLETRQSCVEYVTAITQLFRPEQQENRKRFEDAFMQTEQTVSEDMPADFKELFNGNNDNEFRLGVKFTRKTMKYYSQFYASDIIFASPLGLRRAIDAEASGKSDHDFLSSIELLIVDQADAMLMQNWEHVELVLKSLNLQPTEAHGCDFSRVRKWYLDQNARHLRQTIVFSAHLTPELNGLFSAHMQNVAGKVKIVPEQKGSILDVAIPVRQGFNRLPSRSPASDPDDRFRFFTSTIIPSLNKQLSLSKDGLGALIFIPSYLDFVRIRNYFSTSQDTQNLSFGSISEYTDKADSRRARSHFFAGRQSVMLYTGRAHHFNRYRLRGVKRVVLYGVPNNEKFYPELVGGYIGEAVTDGKIDIAEASVRVLFSKWDGLALERIVGSKRVGKMVRDGGDDTFEFS